MTYDHLVTEGNNAVKGIIVQASVLLTSILKPRLVNYTCKDNYEIQISGQKQCFGATDSTAYMIYSKTQPRHPHL